MKILYLANIRLPTEKAHGIQIMKTCEAFARLGHKVELVVPTRRTHIADDPFTYYDVDKNFALSMLRVPDFVRFGRFGFLLSALLFSERARFLRSFWEADVIYSRDAFVLLQYLLLGRKLVFEAHAGLQGVSGFVARHAYRVVAISHGVRDAFVAAGVPSAACVVAPDGIDLDAFAQSEPKDAARVRLGLPLDKKIVLYAGRLDGWKGVGTLCDAAALLPEDVLVSIIGGEPGQVAAFAERYPRVRFLGYRPYRELPGNQAAADVLVLPNTGKDETSVRYTSPLKLFTYMASGVPIVTSDTPATREVLSDDDAYFFTPDDPDALAAQARAILGDEYAAHARAERAKEKVKEYTWTKRVEHILAAIR